MRALLLALVLSACAVKGYDLGWQKTGPFSELLGSPRDALSGCTWRPDEAAGSAACRSLVADIGRVLSGLPATTNAPEALGATCRAEGCAFSDAYLRRDVGAAAIVPVYKRVVLREARMRFQRGAAGWQLAGLSIRDVAPPGYGPVRIGGRP